MKAATVKELKEELGTRSQKELLELCLRLSKFKKENKELLTYLLYEAEDEESYIQSVKSAMDIEFENINTKSFFYMKKSIRKILRYIKKYVRYSKKKETEVELLIYFCQKMKTIRPSIQGNIAMKNLYKRQIGMIDKALKTLHEDIQFDYQEELNLLR